MVDFYLLLSFDSMDFGKVAEEYLTEIDFTLPPDTAATKRMFKSLKPTETRVHVGCAKWGRKEWVGKIYPKGTKEKDFLEAYGKQFNSIEFNAIFYKLPSHEQVRIWCEKVPADFKFCPKFTDIITHIKRLKNAQHETNLLFDVLSEFGDKLGPMFLMPHPQMGPKHLDTIALYLESLPKEIKVFVELRHAEWFKGNQADSLFDFCREHAIGMVITDASGRRDCVHMELTTPQAFVRFVGNGLHATDYTRIDDWVKRIKQWQKKGIEDVWFFMHQHDEQYSPELCKYLIDSLNKECKLSIYSPQFVGHESPF